MKGRAYPSVPQQPLGNWVVGGPNGGKPPKVVVVVHGGVVGGRSVVVVVVVGGGTEHGRICSGVTVEPDWASMESLPGFTQVTWNRTSPLASVLAGLRLNTCQSGPLVRPRVAPVTGV